MDLRLIVSSLKDNRKTNDAGAGKFVSSAFNSKYYKDKLKSVLVSKLQVNALSKNFPGLDEETISSTPMPLFWLWGLSVKFTS